ncbi:MFS transporter [Ensifer sp. Root31]|uniref:MFS transporter n=1 Tax=Ensifer sp. Root31 TaxID=1736512 RepID=UPI000B31930B|nr:MFS transporter [Ensifer sp. Root31]
MNAATLDSKTLRLAKSFWPFAGLQITSVFVNLSNAITAVVYPWLVYDMTGSVSWMGVIAALALFPAVGGMAIGGLVAERLGIRQIALVSTALGAAASVAAAAAYDAGALSIGIFAILTVLGAILDGPGGVAIEARVPEMARIARMPLLRANAIDDLIDSCAGIIAPATAAFLVAIVSTTDLLWLVAISNIIATTLVALSVPRFRLRRRTSSPFAEVKTALKFITSSRTFRVALTLASIGTGVFVAFETIALPGILKLSGASATLLGMFMAAAGTGAVAVNLALAMRANGAQSSLRNIFVWAFIGLAAGVALVTYDRSAVSLIAAGGIFGISAGPLTPVFTTLLQVSAPKALRANLIGVSMSLILLSAPIAALIAGVALDAFGPTIVLVALVAVLGACAFAAFFALVDGPAP